MTKSKKLPPVEVLQEMLSYCPESGVLRWKFATSRRVKKGEVAGSTSKVGYVSIKVKGKLYMAHRIAWALHYGEDPAFDIDHKNGNKSDNRIANLRLVTRSENVLNVTRRSTNSSGHRGVSYHSRKKKWGVQIDIKGERHYLGAYDCLEDAIAARLKAETDNNIYVCDT